MSSWIHSKTPSTVFDDWVHPIRGAKNVPSHSGTLPGPIFPPKQGWTDRAENPEWSSGRAEGIQRGVPRAQRPGVLQREVVLDEGMSRHAWHVRLVLGVWSGIPATEHWILPVPFPDQVGRIRCREVRSICTRSNSDWVQTCESLCKWQKHVPQGGWKPGKGSNYHLQDDVAAGLPWSSWDAGMLPNSVLVLQIVWYWTRV